MRKLVAVLLGATLISTVISPVNWARAENPKTPNYYDQKIKKPAPPKSKTPEAPKPVKMPELKGWSEQTRDWAADHPMAITIGAGIAGGVVGCVAGPAGCVAGAAYGLGIGTTIGLGVTVGTNVAELKQSPSIPESPAAQNPQATNKGNTDKNISENKKNTEASEKKSQKLDENKKPTKEEGLDEHIYNKAKTEVMGYVQAARNHPTITSAVVGTAVGVATFVATRKAFVSIGAGVAAGLATRAILAVTHDNKAPAKACPPSAPPAKKPHHHKKPTTSKQPTSTPSTQPSSPSTTKPGDTTKNCSDFSTRYPTPPPDATAFDKQCCTNLPPIPSQTTTNAIQQLQSTAGKTIDPGTSAMGANFKPAPTTATIDIWAAVRKFCAPSPATSDKGAGNNSPIITSNAGTAVPSPATAVDKSSGTIDDSKNTPKDTSKSKIPWQGMGIAGAYGGLLGSLLLGPVGMFIFGIIGIGLGYLMSQ